MNITLTIPVSGQSRDTIAATLRKVADELEGASQTTSTKIENDDIEAKPSKTTAGKKTKSAPVEDDETFDLGESETEEVEEPTYTRRDVSLALQAYAEKHTRNDAAKILIKFKAKSPKDLTEEQIPKIMKLLKV